jgi:hypothetical protein
MPAEHTLITSGRITLWLICVFNQIIEKQPDNMKRGSAESLNGQRRLFINQVESTINAGQRYSGAVP